MGLFYRKTRVDPKIAEAEKIVMDLLTEYYPFTYGDKRGLPGSELKAEARQLLYATIHGGTDEICRELNGQKTKVFSAKQIAAIRLLITGEEGVLEARQRILPADFSGK